MPRLFEANVIYDTQTRSIQQKGELLRLRTAGARNVLTWKGASVPGRHKSRPETEVEFSSFEPMDQILRRLGYEPVFRYEKYRTEFAGTPPSGVVTLDKTPIGCYLELEGEAAWIDASARQLGFSEADYITGSYGALYRSWCERSGKTPGWMVFQA